MSSNAPNPDQCAVGADNQLLTADKIQFRYDVDSPDTLPPANEDEIMTRNRRIVQDSGASLAETRPRRGNAGQNMSTFLEEEKLDVDKQLKPKFRAPNPNRKKRGQGRRRKANGKTAKATGGAGNCDLGESTDSEDSDFEDGSGSEFGSEDEDNLDGGEEGEGVVDNDELADMLPAKTNPNPSKRPKRKLAEIFDAPASRPQEPRPLQASTSTASVSSQPADTSATDGSGTGRRRSPIFLFFEEVETDSSGQKTEGTRYYKCYHGQRRTLSITKKMKSNTKHMVEHLRTSFKTMHQLFVDLQDRKAPPTAAEVALASATEDRDDPAVIEVLRRLKNRDQTINAAFQAQTETAWDQTKFEKLLVEWVAACDQPLDEVDKPEFRELLQYVHSPARKALKIPGRTTVRRRLMEMGADAVKETTDMFKSLDTKVAISLDAWTSENQYAFLAIVAHYVSKEGELEELLIDFREIQGAHTGENLADLVWRTMETYGLLGKVIAFVMDNATNNDTLVQSIERRCLQHGIPFSADDARMRCTPHIIHLAALELLQGIGAITSEELDAALHSGLQYQDDVFASLPRRNGDGAGGEGEEDAGDGEGSGDTTFVDDESDDDPKSSKTLNWMDKLRRIIKYARSSPQRREAWLKEATILVDELKRAKLEGPARALMLILDVRTRWSSTYSMLSRALSFRTAVTYFTAKNLELRKFELSDSDWTAIETVCKWLECFQAATREMSSTRTPMLSTTIAIFRGLQQQIKEAIRSLPPSTSPSVRNALVKAHKKLSDYYFRFDTSSYGTWAALLDPRISYDGLKIALGDDLDLLSHLESAKSKLELHYGLHYKSSARLSTSTTTTASSSTGFNFTAAFRRAPRAVQDELEAYFRMPPEDYETCQPIQWWYAHRLQFPTLHKLAFDILCIPGSAVAVERIFSGGRDLISVRRASLRPDTIRILMIVKQKVRARRLRLRVYTAVSVYGTVGSPNNVVYSLANEASGRILAPCLTHSVASLQIQGLTEANWHEELISTRTSRISKMGIKMDCTGTRASQPYYSAGSDPYANFNAPQQQPGYAAAPYPPQQQYDARQYGDGADEMEDAYGGYVVSDNAGAAQPQSGMPNPYDQPKQGVNQSRAVDQDGYASADDDEPRMVLKFVLPYRHLSLLPSNPPAPVDDSHRYGAQLYILLPAPFQCSLVDGSLSNSYPYPFLFSAITYFPPPSHSLLGKLLFLSAPAPPKAITLTLTPLTRRSLFEFDDDRGSDLDHDDDAQWHRRSATTMVKDGAVSASKVHRPLSAQKSVYTPVFYPQSPPNAVASSSTNGKPSRKGKERENVTIPNLSSANLKKLEALSKRHIALQDVFEEVPDSRSNSEDDQEPSLEDPEVLKDLEGGVEPKIARNPRIRHLRTKLAAAREQCHNNPSHGKWELVSRLLRLSVTAGGQRWVGARADRKPVEEFKDGWCNAETEQEWFEWEARYKEEQSLKTRVSEWSKNVVPVAPEEGDSDTAVEDPVPKPARAPIVQPVATAKRRNPLATTGNALGFSMSKRTSTASALRTNGKASGAGKHIADVTDLSMPPPSFSESHIVTSTQVEKPFPVAPMTPSRTRPRLVTPPPSAAKPTSSPPVRRTYGRNSPTTPRDIAKSPSMPSVRSPTSPSMLRQAASLLSLSPSHPRSKVLVPTSPSARNLLSSPTARKSTNPLKRKLSPVQVRRVETEENVSKKQKLVDSNNTTQDSLYNPRSPALGNTQYTTPTKETQSLLESYRPVRDTHGLACECEEVQDAQGKEAGEEFDPGQHTSAYASECC
ncbi:hypothetical protein NMY22_g16486 [Coprinellus aureogranulatus]|nr:hypothetical protein NMY22_g16486 [Coprinellus aureogranulatus]